MIGKFFPCFSPETVNSIRRAVPYLSLQVIFSIEESARGWYALTPGRLEDQGGPFDAPTFIRHRHYLLWLGLHSRKTLSCSIFRSGQLQSAAREMRQSNPSTAFLPGLQ